jgi:sugar lactone lactonase YvrE
VSTLAGSSVCGAADGIGANARFQTVTGLAADGQGNLYVADATNATIRKITATGIVTTFAGKAGEAGSNDGPALGARFWVPKGIAVGPAGEIYVADTFNYTIRRISVGGVVTTIAGSAGQPGTIDGVGANARFGEPLALAVDPAGNIYVADGSTCTVRKVTAAGAVTTLAGSVCGFADGPAASARFGYLPGIDIDADHNVYLADAGSNSIRRISESGIVTTLTSQTRLPGTAEGTGSSARIPLPWSVKMDAAGNLFVMDPTNHRILVGREALPDRGSIDQTTAMVGVRRTLSMVPDTATSWQWTVIRRPADSRAQLSSSTSKTPGFTPDKAGLYQFSVRASRSNVMSITTVSLDAMAFMRHRAVRR